MSSGGNQKSAGGPYTLTVRGNVTVQVSKTAVAARKASVLKTGDQIIVDVMGATLTAVSSSKYSCKRGAIGDGMVQTNSFTFGRGNRLVSADTFTQVPIEHGRTIDTIEVFDRANVVISSDELLAGVLHLHVSGDGTIKLPKGQVHRIHVTASGRASVVGPKPDQCMWASEAEIWASDESEVSGIKVLNTAAAKATEDASVSFIVAKDAVTAISGHVEVVRVK